MPRPHKLANDRGHKPNKPSYFTRLPSYCPKDVPEWPFINPPNDYELQYWMKLWHKPQAHLWHQTRCFEAVARYVIQLGKIDARTASASDHAEIRQSEERLAMTPAAMYRLYLTVDDEIDEIQERTELGEAQKKQHSNRPKNFVL